MFARSNLFERTMQTELVSGIEQAYAEHTNPIVFALTGRTGSGCTTAASTLSKQFSEITVHKDDSAGIEARKLEIATEYARAQWVPFAPLTVSSVIFSFLLHEPWSKVEPFLVDQKVTPKAREEFKGHLELLACDPRFPMFETVVGGSGVREEKVRAWEMFAEEMHVRAQQTKKVLGGSYPPLFQKIGDNIRLSGLALDSTVNPIKLFSLMDRVCKLVDCCTEFQMSVLGKPARIVVDAIRNPLELVYLRRRIAGLYVVAITVDDDVRKQRLVDIGLNKKEIDGIDVKEYPETKHLEDYASFVSQNLKDCIQKSDVFVANPGAPGKAIAAVGHMNAQLVRYVALALRPGLVTPTRDERCMQIAFVAKLNSGCISRQVGAVVADSAYSVHAIGWNDTPKGQTACLLRDVNSLLNGDSEEDFSEYEKTDPKLRTYLEQKFAAREVVHEQKGLACPFCFKDAYNDVTKERNQVHTRSLHAEENAFLQVAKRGGTGIEGGVLYTTASPCELCSKKAYQLGIKEIVYVDPYPGISASHILKSGPSGSQPELRLFSGAVGHAYHRLYQALLSIKDEYKARLAGK